MEVVTDEFRVRERLCHQHRGPAVPAADVGHLRTALQFFDHAFERRKPIGDQVVVVARPEEPRHGTEHAPDMIVPWHAPTSLESVLHLRLRIYQ